MIVVEKGRLGLISNCARRVCGARRGGVTRTSEHDGTIYCFPWTIVCNCVSECVSDLFIIYSRACK